MKTNAEILNKKLKERGKLNSSVWDWIETEDIEELMDKSRAEGKEEGRAEERKKHTNIETVLQCNSTNTKPKITREQVEER